MARFVSSALASVLIAASAQAQVAPDAAPNPWLIDEKAKPERSFDIMDDVPSAQSNSKGSRIIAGTELMANTAIGFGLFGEKADRPDHATSINRDYSVPKTRKAAVGVAVRF